ILLHCAMRIFLPSKLTGAKGEPVATSARPLVQLIKSSAVASDLEVGLERGKIIGRGVLRAISRTIDSVKAPLVDEKPRRTVASIFPITSGSPIWPLTVRGHSATRSAGCAYTCCSGVRSVRPL